MPDLVSPRDHAEQFDLPGPVHAVERHPGGHINRSYLVACDGTNERFLMQRINAEVFPDPLRVMDNVARVTGHVTARRGGRDPFLQLLPTRDGRPFLTDEGGVVWRTYHYIEGAMMRESAATPAEAAEAGRAFGEFQALLADLPEPRLHEVIRDFHVTPRRYARFHELLAADASGRAAGCGEEIAFALSQEPLAGRLVDAMRAGRIPERAVHNDAKMSNVLLDRSSGQALCVVDLDTVMPGSPLYDFGDMMRTMLCPAPEDETDLAQVVVRSDMFEALVSGYLGAARDILNDEECAHLVFSGILITLETGVRFLADHLNGDRYFGADRPGQNLDRARCQFALVRSMQERRAELESIATRCAAAAG